ncbi:hypothetical protein BRC65_05715 [Halobacteriales archaeon QH_2_65_14]|nr:MAG: hypothetical protein BRC65_05715 [Halobacteriales archaeon QH_2_65_14]
MRPAPVQGANDEKIQSYRRNSTTRHGTNSDRNGVDRCDERRQVSKRGEESAMTGDGTDGTGSQLTRREVLATVSAGGMAGLAGCSSLQNECKLEVNKSVDGEFHYGQTGTYVFEVCSLQEGWFFGQEDCTETITIVDDLPNGISFDSVSGSNWTATTGGGVVELENDSYGTLDTGECLTFEMDVTVDSAGAFPGSPPHEVENCAQLQYDGEDYRPIGDNCVTHDITHDDSGECDLSLSKDTLGPFNYGQQATYVFDVCNDGDGECTGPLTIRDDLPNGISFDSVGGSNWTASTGGGIVELENDSYGSLAPGACLTVEMTVSVAPAGEVPEEVENCGRLHHDGQVVAEDCVGHDITHDDCNLSFSKETDGEFHYSQQGTYVVTVCNEGEEVCTGPLTVEDELPDGITFASIVGSDWTGTAAGGVVEVTSTTGGLAPGACTDFEMTVDVAPADDFPGDPPGEVTNCAELFHDGAVVGEDCVTHQVTEHPCELTLEKRVGWQFHYGQLASYVFEVCNDSEVACTGELAIEDDLPDGISVASVDSGWTTTASGGVVELANDTASLDPGECLTVEMTVEVAPAADFPGDPTHSVTNCADLFHAGTFETEDCVTTRITRPDGCPPVEFDLNTG